MTFISSANVLLISLALVQAEPKKAKVPFDETQAKTLQQEWAESLQSPVEWTNNVGMKFVFIPPGQFSMGPNGSAYRVRLSQAFYIATTEVTLGQFRQWRKEHQVADAAAEFNQDDRPAAMVNWLEAQEYCQWLTEQPAEKEAGRVYALPTEAQWEWAARAGTATVRHFGDEVKGLEDFAWFNHTYKPNPRHEAAGRGRQVVAGLKPNAWGLHDMLGNVWEWCADRHINPATGETRDPVMRGGSWRSGGFHCTSIAHDPGSPNQRADNIGFRLACRLVKKPNH